MTDLTSNVYSAQGFMTNMLSCVEKNLENRLDPMVRHLLTGLTLIRTQGLDVSTWDGISALAPHSLSFMSTHCLSIRCFYCVASNVALDATDILPYDFQTWLDQIGDNLGDDRAIADSTLVGHQFFPPFGGTSTQFRTVDESGSATNSWVTISRDVDTYEPAPDGYPIPGVRANWVDTYGRNVHDFDLKPGEVRFAEVDLWNWLAPGPSALFVPAMVALYQADRRVAFWAVGFELAFLSSHLASMDLQGGFVFLVENSTGFLVASSDPNVSVVSDESNVSEKVKPIDSTSRLIRGAAVHLAPTGEWQVLKNALVEGEVDAIDYFFQCFLFEKNGLNLVGVYAVPTSIILGDTAANARIGSIVNFTVTIVMVACMFVVFLYRLWKLRHCARLRKRASAHEVGQLVLAASIADKLVNYDLHAAQDILKEECLAVGLAQPLAHLLDNLTSFSPFLPQSLFHYSDAAGLGVPNQLLADAMRGHVACLKSVHSCVGRLRDVGYSLLDYAHDINQAFPELSLFTTFSKVSSGLTGNEEYERTMGAFFALYCLLRIDLDGKEVLSFGVSDAGNANQEPKDNHEKKSGFHTHMNWEAVHELTLRADLLRIDRLGQLSLCHDRVVAMLVLTAIHDVMKNTALTPSVLPQHAPYQGYLAEEPINDHDMSLAYILEFFPTLLPSYQCLEPGQRAPILFTQGKMGFNNGWLVQGEAPPGLLFGKFKQVIARGRTSPTDINFYFVHWFTDLAGADVFRGKPWPGAEKITTKFPVKVLAAFLDSFGFVDGLATKSEVQVLEEYLADRWQALGQAPLHTDHAVALQRLTLMAQGFEQDAIHAFHALSTEDQLCLTEELARSGHRTQFQYAPVGVRSRETRGPALMLYYAPALLQKAAASHCLGGLMIIVAVFRAARELFPCHCDGSEKTVTIRIDALKVLRPLEALEAGPWQVCRTGDLEACVQKVCVGNETPSLTASVCLFELQHLIEGYYLCDV
uniref:Uncharacterized protein n=1 Tax=Noctiluca scintillans TaxID=2966 RepID=A0A7S1B0T1_NOCSC|eukprot:CAMPEP_0194488828 /NCGR_PEP_ID=MMETSP0253-20130528/8603_1 /TAXON_ID=2966 /ORGANISM="Noctiluca scintillans" /LENGTH=980 /DNA_ID=CAMNT_0039329233 /DNA_START=99 /DNA_END=3041 /DNA_ORIENTATION=+